MGILLISGDEDPVGDGGKGVKLVGMSMKKAGLNYVDINIYTGGRHDILHEKTSGISGNVSQKINNWISDNYNVKRV